jgi:hypothetical protein
VRAPQLQNRRIHGTDPHKSQIVQGINKVYPQERRKINRGKLRPLIESPSLKRIIAILKKDFLK